MGRVWGLPAGRRSKFGVLIVGLLVCLALASQAGKLNAAASGGGASDLPHASEAGRFNRATEAFGSKDVLPAVIVFRRDAGLTARDRARILGAWSSFRATPVPNTLPAGRPVYAADDRAALLTVPVRNVGNGDPLTNAVEQIRHRVRSADAGLVVKVTGPAGFQADIAGVFNGADTTLLFGTALLVLVLLVIIYRSPIFWLIPFVTVLLAEGAAEGLGYFLTRLGLPVDQATSGIMSVLVFGAGTDYALLLVARYREELRSVEDKHEAMHRALKNAGTAIVASGTTVCLCLLVLLVATISSTRTLGPLSALGVFAAMLAMLTILPAALVIVGRRAFWPFIPRPGAHLDPATQGVWRRFGELSARRPRLTWLAIAFALGALGLGLSQLKTTLAPSQQFTQKVEAIDGQRLLERSFPAGSSATAGIYLPGVGAKAAKLVAARIKRTTPLVAGLPRIQTNSEGTLVELALRDDPFSTRAIDAVPALRKAAHAAGGAGPSSAAQPRRTTTNGEQHAATTLSSCR